MINLSPERVGHYQNTIKRFDGKIRRLEFEIQRTREPYLKQIEEMKEKYSD